jgi:hypothetical protein
VGEPDLEEPLVMRPGLPFVEPTQADVDVYTFRIERRTGSVCCQQHHLVMTTLCLVDDALDAEALWRSVRTCESLRWADIDIGEHLREHAIRESKCDPRHRAELFANFLKKELDF